MSIKIPISISFPISIVDFDSYFLKFDSTKYDGKLREWMDSGKLIEVEERHYISMDSLKEKRAWYYNFEALCPSLRFSENDTFKLLRLKEWFGENQKPIPYFKSDFFDTTCKEMGIDLLFHILMNGIYEQPLMYLDAIEQYPDSKDEDKIAVDKKTYNRQKEICNRIRICESRCKNLFINISAKLALMSLKDKDRMLTALSGVFLFVEKELNTLKCGKYDYGFDFISSPLVVVLLDFLNDIKKYSAFSGGNGSLPNVDKYLNELGENKKKFEYVEQEEVIIPQSKQTNLTGFESTLTSQEIQSLFDESIKDYIKTDLQNFINLLSGVECRPIEWIYYYGSKPNKLALRAYIEAVFQSPKEPRKIGRLYFVDNKNNPIELSKPVKNPNYEGYVSDFKKMLEKNS